MGRRFQRKCKERRSFRGFLEIFEIQQHPRINIRCCLDAVDLFSKSNMKRRIIKILVVVAILALAAVLVPTISSHYVITVVNGALVFYVGCLGICVMLGYGGMVSFATITFMGLGAYMSANLSLKAGMPFLVCVLGSMIFAGLCALIIGAILLRLSGTFFTFSTVALVLIAHDLFTNLRSLTGGPDGMGGIPPFNIGSFVADTAADNFYFLFVAGLLAALFVHRLKYTNLGRRLAAVRDNEIAAATMGVDVYRTKVVAFIIAGVLSGLSGSLMVHNYHFVGSTSFVFDQSTTMVIMAMLGGVSHPGGVFLGTMIITMLPEWLKPLQEYIRLFYGLGVMLLMVFMPTGLWGLGEQLSARFKERFHLTRKTLIGSDDASSEEMI